MENSILTSTKKILGLEETYTAFDLDILVHINSAFSILSQLGVGPTDGFMIEDATDEWGSFDVSQNQLALIRTYIFLKVRLLFDPPTTSYLLEAVNKQIQEYEWRISAYREETIPWTQPVPVLSDDPIF